MIPADDDLSLTKMANGGLINIDGANVARGYHQNLVEEVQKDALAWGMTESEIKKFEWDCWHQMRNVWFGVVTKALSLDLSDALKYDLSKIHPMLQVNIDLVEIYCAMEKCFAKTANYAKGDGSLFDEYQKTYNPNSHHY